MNKQNTEQKLKAERVQAPTPGQVQQRLKAERVQVRLRNLPGWKLQSGGKSIDRVRKFPDAQVAASYVGYAALLASRSGQPLQTSVNGQTVTVTLLGRSTRPGSGLTEEVLDLAEQLG